MVLSVVGGAPAPPDPPLPTQLLPIDLYIWVGIWFKPTIRFVFSVVKYFGFPGIVNRLVKKKILGFGFSGSVFGFYRSSCLPSQNPNLIFTMSQSRQETNQEAKLSPCVVHFASML
jgi:hypothetical protein